MARKKTMIKRVSTDDKTFEDVLDEFIVSRFIHQEKVVKETYSDDEIKRLVVKPNLRKCSFAEYRNWVMVLSIW